jgi:hypothetical protein
LSGVEAPFAVADGVAEDMEGNLACGVTRDVVVVGALAVVGRVAVGLVPAASDILGGGRLVADSAVLVLDEIAGRRGALVVLEGAIVDRRSAVELVLDGEVLVVVEDERVESLRVRPLSPGFLFSSPDVREARSWSCSEPAVFEADAMAVLRAVVPATGRVGGLFKLDPRVDERVEEVVAGFAVVVDGREVVVVGRLAADPTVDASGRRGAASDREAVLDTVVLFFGGVADSGFAEDAGASVAFTGAASVPSAPARGGAAMSAMVSSEAAQHFKLE